MLFLKLDKIIIFLIICVYSLHAATLNIAVAANVSYAINELKAKFHQKHPNINVEITLGGSGKLTAQILHGAPYDLLLSANMAYPEALYNRGFATTPPKVYAQGAVAMLSTHVRDFSQGIFIVKSPNIKRIAIANPKTAPYGKATVEALKNAKLYKAVKNKFVYGESISQTVAYTMIAADIGFVAKSALYSKKMQRFKEHKNWIAVNPKLYTPIKQGVVILKRAKNNHDATLFYDFLTTSDAKAIFKKYGYNVE